MALGLVLIKQLLISIDTLHSIPCPADTRLAELMFVRGLVLTTSNLQKVPLDLVIPSVFAIATVSVWCQINTWLLNQVPRTVYPQQQTIIYFSIVRLATILMILILCYFILHIPFIKLDCSRDFSNCICYRLSVSFYIKLLDLKDCFAWGGEYKYIGEKNCLAKYCQDDSRFVSSRFRVSW